MKYSLFRSDQDGAGSCRLWQYLGGREGCGLGLPNSILPRVMNILDDQRLLKLVLGQTGTIGWRNLLAIVLGRPRGRWAVVKVGF